MWQVLALSFTIIGGGLMYLTNKNQQFLKKAISKKWRLASYLFLVLSFFFWLQNYVFSAALFLWVFITSTVFICIPLISLAFHSDNKANLIKVIK